MNSFFGGILAFFFPRRCISCGRKPAGQEYSVLCANCADYIRETSASLGNKCVKCSTRLYDAPPGLCFDCADRTFRFGGNTSLLSYKNPVIHELVLSLKFEANREAARDVAMLIEKPFADFMKTAGHDIVTAVPLSRGGMKKRGFNQVHLVLHYLGRDFTPILTRREHDVAQSKLGLNDRRAAVKGQFEAAGNLDTVLHGKRILLIDDIFTTGSTADECTSVLLDNGAASVDILTFFRA
ncbi:MAG: hypothetical protein A2Y33_08985 [Spirochaetes bacterium GWF1_51_8]|nr:MAG: hypothetical protein A2Y33_08985 [Spirochaetes bacterium GWF1_51_8]